MGKIFINLKGLSKHNTKSRDHTNKGEFHKNTHTPWTKERDNQQTGPQHTIKNAPYTFQLKGQKLG